MFAGSKLIKINMSGSKPIFTVVMTCTTSNGRVVSWKPVVFGFNHKVMIIEFMSHHLIIWSLENLIVCKSLSKRISCARK
jgi:hypothetical protein